MAVMASVTTFFNAVIYQSYLSSIISPGAELGPYALNMLWHFFWRKVQLQSWL